MGRSKSYIREEALEKIMFLFWEEGFSAMSLNKIQDETGLNKKSLYNEFGSKEELYFLCLEYYLARQYELFNDVLLKKPLGMNNLEEFFSDFHLEDDHRGCFAIKTIVDSGSVPKKALELAMESQLNLEKNMTLNLIDTLDEVEAQKKAFLLVTLYNGLMVQAQSYSNADKIKNLRALIESILKL